jgi:hypothetical protein
MNQSVPMQWVQSANGPSNGISSGGTLSQQQQ